MSKPNHILIVDANSVGYSSQGTRKLHSGGVETQSAFGFMNTMLNLRRQYPQYTPLVLWDGKADWRFKLHPDYKSNRDTDPVKVKEREAYNKMRPYIKTMLCHLGVRQMTGAKQEADDMAGYFVRKLSAIEGSQIGLITGDMDWAQLVRQNVFWRDMRDDAKLINAKNFYEKTGCLTPFAFLETKILMGDTSDVISGVGGIGEKGAPEFIAEFGSVRKFWQLCESGKFEPKLKAHKRLLGTCDRDLDEWNSSFGMPDDLSEKEEAKTRKKHADAWPGQGRSIYRRNFQLMQLLQVPAPAKEDVLVETGKWDKEAFAKVCEELAFTSILRNLDEFTNRFKA